MQFNTREKCVNFGAETGTIRGLKDFSNPLSSTPIDKQLNFSNPVYRAQQSFQQFDTFKIELSICFINFLERFLL